MNTPELDFVEVMPYENWCEIDCYGPVTGYPRDPINRVKTGDLLDIKWKDGTIDRHNAIVENSSYEVSDMGHPSTIHISKACVDLDIKGSKARVYLRGLKVRKISNQNEKI